MTADIAGPLEPYLIAPPWKDDLLKKFPQDLQDELAGQHQPTGLGHHPKYGYFALGTGQGPFVIWLENDPDRPKPEPVVEEVPLGVHGPEPFKGLDIGYVSFCPYCGSKLRVVHPEDEKWGDFCAGYRDRDRTEWYLCTGDCVFRDVPLVLHNPVNGWDKPPGDNWAIGYVK